MTNTPGDLELQTHDPNCQLRLTAVERFDGGSGWRCMVHVRSGGFQCERPLSFDGQCVADAIKAIERMDTGREGEARSGSRWEEDFLRVEANDLDHASITGELHEVAGLPQMIRFGFRTDQTVLRPLIRDLQRLPRG